ncbi:hypothetical protein CAG63_18340 [Vibrio sp. V37_P2S8PM304]|uniref:hypothetical protein n=1 Tax=Vibrio sp. V37_P2S8PM304 TaxID=1938688 RepID=UPI0013735AC7|nr:hypothetical protein [Vibrio sp. V37_P2S8PM304]NAX32007.1 hypothetical protein [Vibrio sp. V37_P2S8PM304]
MTLMLHPNKENPTSYRLQDKTLNVQLYFPFKKHGSMANAKRAAEIAEKKVFERRKFRSMRFEIAINKLFYPDGRIIGLRLGQKIINGQKKRRLIAQITVDGKQIKTDRSLENKNFHTTYNSIVEWILDKRGIDKTIEIEQMIRAAEWLYRI